MTRTEGINNVRNIRIFNIPWLWLLLALAILSLLLLKKCSNSSSFFNDNYLPPQSGIIIPIDSNDIIPDKDSLTKIVSNRLNIVLKSGNTDLIQFANDFKAVYPNNEYKIIYYDTLTKRLQITVPKELLYATKDELPSKLPQYNMLIWPEHLFTSFAMPNDPDLNKTSVNWYLDQIQAFQAWNITQGSSNITIAVIDDGFDIKNKELSKPQKQWNAISHDTKITSGANNFHGTHVAGTAIARANNAYGLSGIAPNCAFMPIQIANQQGIISMTAVIDAILYAANQGADVINLSLGMFLDEATLKNLPPQVQMQLVKTSFLEQEEVWNGIFEITESKHTTVVMAAGNQNVLIGIDPMQRNPNCIKVSATAKNETKANFSNYGYLSTISAPGVSIYSCVPNNQFEFMDGTSMSSPIVAGAVGLIKSMHPEYSSLQIIQILQKSAKPIVQNNRSIGNLVQLYDALVTAKDSQTLSSNSQFCPDVQSRIDSLKKLIEDLEYQCKNGVLDTLKMPEKITNLDFLTGKWKSTTPLYNDEGEAVTIYFYLNTGQSRIELEEKNKNKCNSKLNINYTSSSFDLTQNENATCTNFNAYSAYTFQCYQSDNNVAECMAKNQSYPINQFKFNLIKVK